MRPSDLYAASRSWQPGSVEPKLLANSRDFARVEILMCTGPLQARYVSFTTDCDRGMTVRSAVLFV